MGLAAATACVTAAGATASTNGLIAFQSTTTPITISTVEPSGASRARVPKLPANSVSPDWSPDGTRLAFAKLSGGTADLAVVEGAGPPPPAPLLAVADIFVINADGTGLKQITHDPVAATTPSWSPDGESIAFTSLRNGEADIYAIDLATSRERRLTTDPGVDRQPAWSPDGSKIAFVSKRSGSYDIWLMAPDGTSQAALTKSAASDVNVAWSPSGDRLAFARRKSGRSSILSVARTGGAPRPLTRRSAGTGAPAWSPDGRQIAFSQSGKLRVISSRAKRVTKGTRVVASNATRPVWGRVPDATATAQGTVTVTTPDGDVQTVAGTTDLPVGSRVDATEGSIVIAFRRPDARAGTPVTTARVADAAFKIAARTARSLSLVVERPACAGEVVAAGAKKRKTRVSVKGSKRSGEVNTRNDHIVAAARGTAYTITETCDQSILTVTQGSVTVRSRRGKRRPKVIRAGHRYVAAFRL